jgi:hypothetical protein
MGEWVRVSGSAGVGIGGLVRVGWCGWVSESRSMGEGRWVKVGGWMSVKVKASQRGRG